MKELYETLMNARAQYSNIIQAKGLDKWQARDTAIYKALSTAIYLVYKQL